MKMLDNDTFKTVVKNTPLVSIDLCLIHDFKMLLGRRNNDPLKGQWFTPGGRIFKNESWQNCIKRVAKSELGININNPKNFKFMGIWDHFYNNSALDKNISTHYVNLPHYLVFNDKPKLIIDNQHEKVAWFSLKQLEDDDNIHPYMQKYAKWLRNIGIDND